MMINKCEAELLSSLTKVGDIYIRTVSIYADPEKTKVELDVYDHNKTRIKRVTRQGKTKGNLFQTSVNRHNIAINVNTGVIIPHIEKFEKDFLLTSKFLKKFTIIPTHLQYDGVLCRVTMKLLEIIPGVTTEIPLDHPRIVTLEGPVRNNLLYLEMDDVKFNINIQTCAINYTLE